MTARLGIDVNTVASSSNIFLMIYKNNMKGNVIGRETKKPVLYLLAGFARLVQTVPLFICDTEYAFSSLNCVFHYHLLVQLITNTVKDSFDTYF